MKTKVIALLVLAVVQSVFSLPSGPYRQITTIFRPTETSKIGGETRLNLHGETIKNITYEFDSTAKNITVEILKGGVEWTYVNFNYVVPAGAEGTVNIYIFTSDPGVFDEIPVAPRDDSPSDLAFEYSAYYYNNSNTDRTDEFSAFFGWDALTCYGNSLWYYANGSREITGGYPNSSFDIVLNIPKGVLGNSNYLCSYINDDDSSGSVRPSLPRSTEAEARFGLYQWYQTIDYTTTPKQYTGMYRFPEIVSYEGGVTWYNGSGTFDIYGGGVGYDYIYYNYTQEAYTYGILDYNFVIRMGVS